MIRWEDWEKRNNINRSITVNNLQNLHPTSNINKVSKIYKHSFSECLIKLDGLTHLLDLIAKNEDPTTGNHLVESAKELVTEIKREIDWHTEVFVLKFCLNKFI